MLLKINLMKNDQVLDIKDKYHMKNLLTEV